MVDSLFDIFALFGIVLAGIFIWAALSPFETLGWWAGWFDDQIHEEAIPSDGLLRVVPPQVDSYVLFLSGVGSTSGETLSYRERGFLERLARQLPNSVIIDDLFPYSVTNLALTSQPVFARLWRWALRRKMHGPRAAGNLINLRNIFQVCTSIDRRYGPIYNQGVAEVLIHGLMRYQYNPHERTPVILVASSGAAQIALGAVTYLKEWLQASVYVVSVGGVFGSDPGLLAVDHFYHLYGTRDRAVRLARLDAGRWSFYASSAWNRARRQGRVTEIELPNVRHSGRTGYLDFRTEVSDGKTYVDRTVDIVADIVRNATIRELAARESAPPPTEHVEAVVDAVQPSEGRATVSM